VTLRTFCLLGCVIECSSADNISAWRKLLVVSICEVEEASLPCWWWQKVSSWLFSLSHDTSSHLTRQNCCDFNPVWWSFESLLLAVANDHMLPVVCYCHDGPGFTVNTRMTNHCVVLKLRLGTNVLFYCVFQGLLCHTKIAPGVIMYRQDCRFSGLDDLFCCILKTVN
jgi:hypothetical protein